MYTGTILWISERDGNGILLSDIDGYSLEVYFDKSVFKDFELAKRGDIVEFTPRVTGGCNCAYDCKLIK